MSCSVQKTGFSLVEVIVVLAIISLLASSIVSYLNDSRKKAIIASQQQTAAATDHAIGDQYVGAWDFNDCSTGTTIDNSGNRHSGTLQGPTWSTDTPWSSGCSLLFSGNSYVVAPVENMPFSSAPRTVTLWLKIFDEHATMPIFSVGQGDCTSKMFDLKLNDGKVQFYSGCNNVTSSISIPPNEWTFVSLSFNGQNSVKIFANGKTETYSIADLSTQPSQFFIGADTADNGNSFRSYYSGMIDNVHLFSTSL